MDNKVTYYDYKNARKLIKCIGIMENNFLNFRNNFNNEKLKNYLNEKEIKNDLDEEMLKLIEDDEFDASDVELKWNCSKEYFDDMIELNLFEEELKTLINWRKNGEEKKLEEVFRYSDYVLGYIKSPPKYKVNDTIIVSIFLILNIIGFLLTIVALYLLN